MTLPSRSPQHTLFTLVRHGETHWNAEDRLQGQLPSELSPLGHRQAEAVAKKLAGIDFDAVYSSDLRRAMQTIRYLADLTGVEVRSEPRVRERSMGVFDGLLWEDVIRRFPEEYAAYKSGNLDYVMPERESSNAVYDRVIDCMEELAVRHRGGHIAVFTHGGVLHRIFRYVTEVPRVGPRRFSLYNGSINVVRQGQDGWRIETWGEIDHLEAIGDTSAN